MILDMSSGDSILAILIGLLGAFLLHVASKLLEASVPFHVSRCLATPSTVNADDDDRSPNALLAQATVDKLKVAFPSAMTNKELVTFIKKKLAAFDYGNSSLVATSLCCDEVNRPLEKDLKAMYGSYFSMGGLAGFPFGGVTGFGAMAHHIPDGGSCLIVYGPHVGIDAQGRVGMIDRRGREKAGACCGSAVAACAYVKKVLEGQIQESGPPKDPLDAQQTFVGSMLLPHAERVHAAEDPMVELPYAMYDAEDDFMRQIVTKGCSHVAGEGKIALLGGIQINTPQGMSDYFLPLRFDVYNNKAEQIAKILDIPCRVSLESMLPYAPRMLVTNIARSSYSRPSPRSKQPSQMLFRTKCSSPRSRHCSATMAMANQLWLPPPCAATKSTDLWKKICKAPLVTTSTWVAWLVSPLVV